MFKAAFSQRRPAVELPDDPTREEIRRIIEHLLEDAEKTNYQKLKRMSGRLRRKDRRTRAGFEKRLMQRWGRAIELYDLFQIIACQLGRDFNRENRPQAAKDQDHVFEALTRIHARACLIASEVRALMVSGHASGADARWRSLHELSVVAYFIKEHGNDVAERYILHAAIRSAKEAEKYQQHHKALGYPPLDAAALLQIQTSRDDLLARYESTYEGDYGWAAGVLQGKPNFARIEQSVGLEHWRPHYGMASHSVHAGFKGMTFDLGRGSSPTEKDFMLAGPSNAGLADAGHGAIIALMNCTVAVLALRPTPETAIGLKLLLRLSDEVGDAFLQAHNKLERDAARYGTQIN